MLKILSKFALLLGCLMSLNACSSGTKTITWREETKLANGQMIIVERSANFRRMYNGNTMGWSCIHQQLSAVLLPQKQEIAWEGKLNPMAIDVAANGEVYFVAIIETGEDMREYSGATGSYHVAFKYKGNGKWMRIPIESVPKDMRPNLFTNVGQYFNGEEHPSGVVVDWATKEMNLSDPTVAPMYKSWSTK